MQRGLRVGGDADATSNRQPRHGGKGRSVMAQSNDEKWMFSKGQIVTLTHDDGSGRVVTVAHLEVVEYDDGLLKVVEDGKHVVYNLRSPYTHRVEIHESPC